jgi:hypothetical protein
VEDAETPDPRDDRDAVVGTPLRDAAVDPKPEDFLAPINAGEANPHGPDRGQPGDPRLRRRPGSVLGRSSSTTTASRRRGRRSSPSCGCRSRSHAGEAVAAEVPDLDDRGPLGLSDPGSAEMGWQGSRRWTT